MAIFKMTDFVEMAIKDEETGAAFYKALAEKTNNDSLKNEYLRLADQEAEHANNYKEILDNLSKDSKMEEYKGQHGEFMNALLESRAFPTIEDAKAAASEIIDDLDALHTAIRIEKDTLIFYLEMKDLIPSTHKEIIENIINEERVHVNDLTKMLNNLNK